MLPKKCVFLFSTLAAFVLVLVTSVQSRAASQPVPVQTSNEFWKGFNVGFVGGYMSYAEPGLMREYGELYGVGLGYNQVNEVSQLSYSLSGDLVGGRILYDGATINTSTGVKTPKTDNASDYLFNARATIGLYRELNDRMSLTPFLGLGYRVLNDKIDGDGSYNRNISYFYVPIGLQYATWINDTWSFSFGADFDVVLLGTVISKLSDIDSSAPDITNHNRGTGYRLEATLRKDLGSFSLHVTPFYQKWKMQQSDGVNLYIGNQLSTLYEPANENDYVGVNIGADF